MSGIFQLLIIAFSLATDAFSVSIAGGVRSHKANTVHALKVAAFFGLFQAFMPILGWLIGSVSNSFIRSIDHWIAFFLLGIIGVRMIREALEKGPEEKEDLLQTKTLIILAIATSIDAFVVGITLPLLNVPFLLAIFTIGVVTFILCFLGFLFGKKLGSVFGKRIEILGGIALIAIGLKILIEHLYF